MSPLNAVLISLVLALTLLLVLLVAWLTRHMNDDSYGLQFSPMEFSIIQALEWDRRTLTAEEIASRIKYIRQEEIDVHFTPILKRLVVRREIYEADGKYGRLEGE